MDHMRRAMKIERAYEGCAGVALLLFVVGVFLSINCIGCNVTYSEGSRDGFVQKISHKGLLIKSWEGELALPGLIRQPDKGITGVWEFSIDDPALVKELQQLRPDERVRIYYREVMINPIIWYGTPYRVVRVERLH